MGLQWKLGNPSIIYTTYSSGSWGGWSQSLLTSGESWGTLWASRQSIAGQFKVASWPFLHVFGLWMGTRAPEGNLRMHRENMQTKGPSWLWGSNPEPFSSGNSFPKVCSDMDSVCLSALWKKSYPTSIMVKKNKKNLCLNKNLSNGSKSDLKVEVRSQISILMEVKNISTFKHSHVFKRKKKSLFCNFYKQAVIRQIFFSDKPRV